MTDKVQKIKEWISKTQDGLMDANGNFEYPEHEGAYHILCNLDAYIDSLQEEPVSEELEKAAKAHSNNLDNICGSIGEQTRNAFKAGAKWQKGQMMANATDMVVGYWMPNGLMLTVDEAENCYNIDEGDRVKVIVIKED